MYKSDLTLSSRHLWVVNKDLAFSMPTQGTTHFFSFAFLKMLFCRYVTFCVPWFCLIHIVPPFFLPFSWDSLESLEIPHVRWPGATCVLPLLFFSRDVYHLKVRFSKLHGFAFGLPPSHLFHVPCLHPFSTFSGFLGFTFLLSIQIIFKYLFTFLGVGG